MMRRDRAMMRRSRAMTLRRGRAMTLRRVAAIPLALAVVVPMSAAPAAAVSPVRVVHTEQVQAGPYTLKIGFSVWPLRALQSLDFTFRPADGISGKTGTLTRVSPDGASEETPLVRHPRALDVWGLDIAALGDEGDWTFRFAVDGPQGQAVGELTGLAVLEQPGPPLWLSWSIGAVPLGVLVVTVGVAWSRSRRRSVVIPRT
ncbi:hypothetical protein [Kribbella sp. DT2]|uniref:hypothetical protein n=1 Tax=Kribbella sp. DT2 TaxID=3393427 RepID=UPI003CF59CAF